MQQLAGFTDEKIDELITKLTTEKMRRIAQKVYEQNAFPSPHSIQTIAPEPAGKFILKQPIVTTPLKPKPDYGETFEEKRRRLPIKCPDCGKVTKPNDPKQMKCWNCLHGHNTAVKYQEVQPLPPTAHTAPETKIE